MRESEWVLRSAYGLKRRAVIAARRSSAGLPMVTIGDARCVADALGAAEAGMDFVDALHRLGAPDCDAFARFVQRMAASARSLGRLAVFEL